MNRHAIASQAHRLPQHELARLLPGPFDWFDRGADVRRALAQAAIGFRGEITCWQDAWNALTGAKPGRPGQLHLSPGTCSECKGRRWSQRSLRMGVSGGVCLACQGSGRGRTEDHVALYAEAPVEVA